MNTLLQNDNEQFEKPREPNADEYSESCEKDEMKRSILVKGVISFANWNLKI